MATEIAFGGGVAKADAEALTALGFINVPEGIWEFHSTSYGDTAPTLDRATVIPLVGKGYNNKHTSNTDSTITHNHNVPVNGTTAISVRARKTSSATWGNMFSDVQSGTIFYPFFYGMDLTATMNGIVLQGDRSAQLEEATRNCVAVYAWLEKVE